MKKHTLFATIGIAVVLIAGIFVSLSLRKTPQINFIAVKKADITQGVNVNGTVDASQDLSLSFQTGGEVKEIDVNVGDTVKKDQVLVKLDTGAAAAAVSQARAALSAAQASYQKLINGATGAQLDVTQAAVQTAQTALDNAKKTQAATIAQQNLIVGNAQSALLNSGLAATPGSGNLSSASPIISGTYTGTAQGEYDIKTFSTGSGLNFSYTGLENGSDTVSTTGPNPLGTKGLYIQFPAGTIYPNDIWTVFIPNTKSVSYLTNFNNYNAALQTQNQTTVSVQAAVDNAQAVLTQAQQNLQLQQTPPRPEDIQTAKAQVDAAAAQLQTAQNNLNDDVLTAPIDGIITSVDVKIGETTQTGTFMPGVEVIKMISNQKLEVITYLSEADIGKIKIGDQSQATLDAYGPQTVFDASVIAIDPSATIISGVQTYKTTLEFAQNDDRIKSGMGANVTIIDQTQSGVLSVPSQSIFTDNNQNFVLKDEGNGQIQKTPVTLGITDLNGQTQITGGLNEGDKIIDLGN